MLNRKDLELSVAASKIVKDLAKLKKDESILITIDSAGEFILAEEVSKAAEAIGAKVHLAYHSTPPGYGKLGEHRLPDSLMSAIPNTDVWIELNNQWLLYNSAFEKAMKNDVRYLFLGGMNVDQIVRCVGKVDLAAQHAFQTKIVEMTKKAKHMRITTAAGNDVSFAMNPKRPINSELFADTPGPHFLLGQISWAPIEETINGKIVFDGSFSGGGKADLGILEEPITLTINNGVITNIDGGKEAKILEKWLKELDDPRMYNMVHVCYGFNPGAVLSGLCTEDERVWGCTEWGFGYQGPMFDGALGDAISHADGICLNSTVYLDGEIIIDEGEVVHEELAELAKKCKQ
ncbi:MAG: leucyl aminopeptidase [Clostridia bacterium]|nr:leucyl aminopeptidase [Clostridia bacterium]